MSKRKLPKINEQAYEQAKWPTNIVRTGFTSVQNAINSYPGGQGENCGKPCSSAGNNVRYMEQL